MSIGHDTEKYQANKIELTNNICVIIKSNHIKSEKKNLIKKT